MVALGSKANGMDQMKTLGLIALGLLGFLATAGDQAWAADSAAAAAGATETCRKAEVNPVTGHVFCFDPIGAPVEAPPAAAEVTCRADAHSGEAWSWSPKCKPGDAAKPAPGAEG
jgi:secreted PhoX family phosphatase